MSLIRKILGMKDLSAEFDIPEVKLNKKSIPKEKKIDKPTPEPVYEKVNHIPNYDSPPPPFNKIELEWVKKGRPKMVHPVPLPKKSKTILSWAA